MATGTNGVATYGDLNTKIKCAFSNKTDNEKLQCVAKESLQSWLWSVSTNDIDYTDNQLVNYSDISVKKTQTITVKVYNGRASGSLGIHWIDVNLIAPDDQSVEIGGADWSGDISNGGNKTEVITLTIPSKIGTHTVDLGKNSYRLQVRIGQTTSNRAFRSYVYSDSNASSTKYYYKNEETSTKIGQITFPFNYVTSTNTSCFLGGFGINRSKYVYIVGSNT